MFTLCNHCGENYIDPEEKVCIDCGIVLEEERNKRREQVFMEDTEDLTEYLEF